MASDESNKPKHDISKGIDTALSDALRDLLHEPAKEVGSLFANTIGLAGDWIKRKRAINLQLGGQEARAKLSAAGVKLDEIAAPREEELYLLLNGMSLAGDADLRNMWAGLFAKSLDPNSSVSAERPFISVLESLSPMDVKVIDFITFTTMTDKKLQESITKLGQNDPIKSNQEEWKETNADFKTVSDLRNKAVRSIKEKADEYGLTSPDPGCLDNLLRQGVLVRRPLPKRSPSISSLRLNDAHEIAKSIIQIKQQIIDEEEAEKRNSASPEKLFTISRDGDCITMEIELSNFGRRFAEACGVL